MTSLWHFDLQCRARGHSCSWSDGRSHSGQLKLKQRAIHLVQSDSLSPITWKSQTDECGNAPAECEDADESDDAESEVGGTGIGLVLPRLAQQQQGLMLGSQTAFLNDWRIIAYSWLHLHCRLWLHSRHFIGICIHIHIPILPLGIRLRSIPCLWLIPCRLSILIIRKKISVIPPM